MAYEKPKVQPLEDNNLCPSGKWKGTKMIDVPATYLMWLWDNATGSNQIRDYISRNLQVILHQAKQDGYGI